MPKLRVQDIPQINTVRNFQYEVDHCMKYIPFDRIDLEPYYQRDDVWTPEQRTAYMEHLFKGGANGRNILLYDKGYGEKLHWEVVDGKQRLTTIKMFLNGEVTVFDNLTVADFDEDDLGHHRNFRLNFKAAEDRTQDQILQWYVALNSTGTAHTEEQLDKVRKLIKE